MKVCFVVDNFNFFVSHRLDLAKYLLKNYEVLLITDLSNLEEKDMEPVKNLGISLFNLKGRLGKANLKEYLRYRSDLKSLMLSIEPEYIFFVTLETSFFGTLVGYGPKIKKVFYIISGLGAFFLRRSIKSMFLRLMYSSAFFFLKVRAAYHFFIFQNTDDKDLFIKKGYVSIKNARLIEGNGVNLEDFKGTVEHTNTNLVFLMATKRLVKSKGVEEFLRASKELFNKYPQISFKMAGHFNQEDPDTISRIIFSEIKDSHIEYLGDVSYQQMKALYKEASVFVLPSHREGLPKVALEAASSGLPLILSDVPGCRSCVKDGVNGFLFDQEDVTDLIRKMEILIQNPELIKSMGKESRRLVEDRFSNEVIAKQYLRLLQ